MFYVDWDFHISIYHYFVINFNCFMWTGMFYVDWDFHISIYHYYLSTLNVLC